MDTLGAGVLSHLQELLTEIPHLRETPFCPDAHPGSLPLA